MKINMTNLNIFKRIDDLETQQLHLQVLLQGARRDIERLQKMTAPKPKAKPGPKEVRTKDALNAVLEKKREYARAYYAKKKAERAA